MNENDLQIDYNAWRTREKPHGISACIRVRNEGQFMGAAVRSIVGLVDEVVLCVQPSDDDTLEQAVTMETTYPGKVKVHIYPLVPDWIDTRGFYERDPDQPGHLVHMSNWALSKCTYSWILKVEGDVIALPTLGPMIQRVLADNRPIYYGLVILNIAGRNMDKFSWEHPRNNGGDEALFLNGPQFCRFHRRGKWEVAVPETQSTCLGWALMHLKRCKVQNADGWGGEHYIDLTPDNLYAALSEYNQISAYPGPDNPYGVPCLFSDEWKQYL